MCAVTTFGARLRALDDRYAPWSPTFATWRGRALLAAVAVPLAIAAPGRAVPLLLVAAFLVVAGSRPLVAMGGAWVVFSATYLMFDDYRRWPYAGLFLAFGVLGAVALVAAARERRTGPVG